MSSLSNVVVGSNMTKCALVLPFAAAALGSWPIVAAPDDVPTFDVAATCRTEAQVDPGAGDVATCMSNEQKARETLANQWEQFSQASKATCLQTAADGRLVRSYVELLLCLQLAKDVKGLPEE
jgi:hypothetical protein